MKRNKNLIELSRDHHHGLLLGWKLKQGIKKGVEISELVKYVAHFAYEALFGHFEEEENQVLVYLNAEDSYRKRTIEEHLEIRGMINQLVSKEVADEPSLVNLADKIDAHIRFEERELFPYMERVLSAKQMEEIGKVINEVHQPYIEKYQNEFWNN